MGQPQGRRVGRAAGEGLLSAVLSPNLAAAAVVVVVVAVDVTADFESVSSNYLDYWSWMKTFPRHRQGHLGSNRTIKDPQRRSARWNSKI